MNGIMGGEVGCSNAMCPTTWVFLLVEELSYLYKESLFMPIICLHETQTWNSKPVNGTIYHLASKCHRLGSRSGSVSVHSTRTTVVVSVGVVQKGMRAQQQRILACKVVHRHCAWLRCVEVERHRETVNMQQNSQVVGHWHYVQETVEATELTC